MSIDHDDLLPPRDGAEQQRCGAPKVDGSPCRSTMGLSPVNGHCLMHDELRAEERKAARTLGGRNSRQRDARPIPKNAPKEPKTLEDAERFSAWLSRAVVIGNIDARTCEAATKSVRQFQLSHEKSALEARIKKLMAELADARRERALG